ncbi:MAG: hypothetical protein NVS4B11_26630 [Ktedonobacteraceae bacterium]
MTTPTLYTMGYLHSSSLRTLKELIALKTPLVDIRKSPHSERLEWNHDMLVQEKSLIYSWIEDLDNDLFGHQNGDIHIHNLDAGMESLSHILDTYVRACILCACAWPNTCHRLTVADEAERRLPGLRVTHLPAVERGKPDVPASVLYTVDENVPGYPVLWLSRSRQEAKVYCGVAGHFSDTGEARTEFESFYEGRVRCLYVEPSLFHLHIARKDVA